MTTEDKSKSMKKTKKCNWCNKRKAVEQGYLLGDWKNEKDLFICDECNLTHDIV